VTREASDERLRRELERHRHLVEASYALHTTLDLDELLGLILDAAKTGVQADRGTVFLLSEDGQELWSRVLTGAGDLVIRLPLGQGIAGAVAATGATVRLDDARKDARFDPSWDKKSGYVTRQLLTAPIRGRDGKVVGVFQLLNKRAGVFDDEDEEFLASLSIHAALAVENARLHRAAIEKERQDREIRLVQDVQRAYQPEQDERAIGRIRVAGMNVLCEDASGDYYDFIELPGGRIAAVIGDVSGHGLGAALVMAQARALLRAFSATEADLPRVLNLLNDFLSADMSGGRFMSAFVALADPEQGVLEWQNAGHPPALLYRAAAGRVERLGAHGRVLGVFPGADFAANPPVRLAPGDTLLLYTDGATEALNREGSMLGEAGLVEELSRSAGGGPAAVLEAVRRRVVEWTGAESFKDDLTLVALQLASGAS
jgi:serine phosphatase RsbU (regulator of sigma subunit)